MNNKDKAKKLEETIKKYIDSGKPINEFIKEEVFKEYSKSGNKKLKEIAEEYFIEHLD